MRVGLTYDQALDLPVGELLDYMAIEQIKHEFCDPASPEKNVPLDEEIIPNVR